MPDQTTAANRASAVGARDALSRFLADETTGGRLLIIATAIALVWANLPGDSYAELWGRVLTLGPDSMHLSMPLHNWASDGLLTVFFFVAGLEVKRELTVGELADRRAAMLPFAGALGGMVVPALVALAVSGGAARHHGAWAIPVATDIAFALGILALAGSSLPSGVRVLLLSMAVIDDVGAIALIVVLFSQHLAWAWLVGGVLTVLAYRFAVRRRFGGRAGVLVALALASWVCVHAGGIHATVAGIALGLVTPVRADDDPADPAIGERLEHRLHLLSGIVVVPLFAIAAAGVPLGEARHALTSAVAHGVTAGLVVGKVVGITGGLWLACRWRVGRLPDGVTWADVVPVAMLGGIGYTVSLLVSHLSLPDAAGQQQAAAAVLGASATAAIAAVVLLRRRGRALTRGG